MRALTVEQEQAAARRSGSLLLAAGAGSGKTSVLVERFVRAVREDGLAPGRILAITFTERAAGELRERIRMRLLELGERDAAREAEAAFVSTFHGFCARLLRTHPLQAGLDPSFQVLDEGMAGRLRRLAFREALAGFQEDEPAEGVDLVAAYGADRLEAMVLDAHARLRSQGQSEPRLPAPAAAGDDEAALRACRLLDCLLAGFNRAYAACKQARAALDFDDLELYARDLLREHAAIRDSWQERLQMLMVDEFQDTNPRQLELLGLLDRDNLFTVGDELQSIYGFRHADVSLFAQRRSRFAQSGQALALTHNFRSRAPILAAVRRAFAQRMGERFTPLVPARQDGGAGAPVELLLTDCRGWPAGTQEDLEGLPQATAWRVAEARLLAARIAGLVEEDEIEPGDVVVLVRGLGDLPLYEAALRAAGLPTAASVGGFWGHQQVGDLLCYLRALANPLDDLALYSTLASPLVGLSSDGLAVVAQGARARRQPAWSAIDRHAEQLQALLAGQDGERLARFLEWFRAERRTAPLRSLDGLLRGVIANSGYDIRVLRLPWGEQRLANVHKLIRLARRFQAQEGRDLRGFLDHAAHLEKALAGREADAPVSDGGSDAVQLMSIHAAKGLEFPVVCVADLGRAPRLAVPDLLVERDGRVGLRLATVGEPELSSALHYEQLSAESKAAQQQEEDRILYVALTRARERLLLSGAADFSRWPAPKQGCPPVAWLAPALVPELPELLAGGEETFSVQLGEELEVLCRLNRPAAERPAVETPAAEAVATAAAEPPLSQGAAADRSALSATPAPTQLAYAAPQPLPLSDPAGAVSYSSLVQLSRCGYRYYLERVLRLKEDRAAARAAGEAQDGLEARVRGTIVHLLLQRIDFARAAVPSDEGVDRAARGVGVRLSDGQRTEIVSLVSAALDSPPARRLAGVADARRELPFAFSLGAGEPLVTGVLDLMAREPDGGCLVVDYKSDQLHPGEHLEALAERDYGLQRLLYALAAIESGAERVQVAHWFLARPQEWASASFQAGQRESLRAALLSRISALRLRGYAVAEQPHRGLCLTCPGRAALCSWGDTHTLAESSPPGPRERVATLR